MPDSKPDFFDDPDVLLALRAIVEGFRGTPPDRIVKMIRSVKLAYECDAIEREIQAIQAEQARQNAEAQLQIQRLQSRQLEAERNRYTATLDQPVA